VETRHPALLANSASRDRATAGLEALPEDNVRERLGVDRGAELDTRALDYSTPDGVESRPPQMVVPAHTLRAFDVHAGAQSFTGQHGQVQRPMPQLPVSFDPARFRGTRSPGSATAPTGVVGDSLRMDAAAGELVRSVDRIPPATWDGATRDRW